MKKIKGLTIVGKIDLESKEDKYKRRKKELQKEQEEFRIRRAKHQEKMKLQKRLKETKRTISKFKIN